MRGGVIHTNTIYSEMGDPTRKNNRSAEEASVDAMFDALRDPIRRRVLFAVSDHGPRDRGEFTVDAFASAEMGETEPDILQVRLFHSHLPRLAEEGYVEWDPDDGTIRRGPAFDEIAPLLDVLVDRADDLPPDLP